MSFSEVVIHPREGRCLFTIDTTTLVVMGVCDDHNSRYVLTGVLAYIALLDDSPLNTLGRKPLCVYLEFLRELLSRPIIDTVKKYSVLSHELMTSSRHYGGEDTFLYEMRHTPIFREYHTWYKSRDPKLLTFILTFLLFLKKMEYEDDDFHDTALRKWRAIEEDLNKAPRYSKDLLSSLERIVHYVCGDLKLDPTDLKFGPGHVADLSGLQDPASKADALDVLPWKLRRLLLGGHINYYEHHVAPDIVLSDLYDISCVESDSMSHDYYFSKTKFVFKDVTTSRTISMERNDIMAFQQLILSGVVKRIERGPMAQFVTLHDQTMNQLYSKFGSETSLLDTIDLSSASDRVSFDLVKSVFPRKWLIPLVATRSSVTKLPDGSMVSVKKFAPMGSALCFPIQCILFTSICILAYQTYLANTLAPTPGVDVMNMDLSTFISRHVLRKPDASRGYSRTWLQPIAVYGDDIICDTRVTDIVFELLSVFGFEVNVSKSFVGPSTFRESCGKYYESGHDVTPLRYRPRFFRREMNTGSYEGFIALCNNSERFGFLNLRSFSIRTLRSAQYSGIRPGVRGVNLPFTTRRNLPGIYVPRRTSYSYVRYNGDLQYHEELVLVTRRRSRNYTSYKSEAYHYYRTRLGTDLPIVAESLSGFSGRTRLGDTQFVKRWTPLRD